MKTPTNPVKWIENKVRRPKLGGEYLVVWNLNDNQYPLTASMDFDGLKKVWTDPRSDNRERDEEILYWANLPKPPKGIKKSIWFEY